MNYHITIHSNTKQCSAHQLYSQQFMDPGNLISQVPETTKDLSTRLKDAVVRNGPSSRYKDPYTMRMYETRRFNAMSYDNKFTTNQPICQEESSDAALMYYNYHKNISSKRWSPRSLRSRINKTKYSSAT